MLKGGCFCGAIRYETGAAPYHLTNCHCSICRRTTGAPFVAWFTVPKAEIRFVQGMPQSYKSTSNGTRGFCPHCGTQLTFESAATPAEIDVTICSLDDPGLLPPTDHTYTGRKLHWIKLADGLPEFYRARPDAGGS